MSLLRRSTGIQYRLVPRPKDRSRPASRMIKKVAKNRSYTGNSSGPVCGRGRPRWWILCPARLPKLWRETPNLGQGPSNVSLQ